MSPRDSFQFRVSSFELDNGRDAVCFPDSRLATRDSQRETREAGFTIVTAVFLIVVLAALGVVIVSVTGLQQSSQALDVQGVRAYQAARAGIEWAAYHVLDPNNTQNPAACSPLVMPSCPASPTHLTGLAGSLSPFTVSVTCTAFSATEGNRDIRVFEVTATACNQPSGGSCLSTTPATGYVERRLAATLTKCRDSTASAPRCACG
jgi:MSHA biogenesis protein MshP